MDSLTYFCKKIYCGYLLESSRPGDSFYILVCKNTEDHPQTVHVTPYLGLWLFTSTTCIFLQRDITVGVVALYSACFNNSLVEGFWQSLGLEQNLPTKKMLWVLSSTAGVVLAANLFWKKFIKMLLLWKLYINLSFCSVCDRYFNLEIRVLLLIEILYSVFDSIYYYTFFSNFIVRERIDTCLFALNAKALYMNRIQAGI